MIACEMQFDFYLSSARAELMGERGREGSALLPPPLLPPPPPPVPPGWVPLELDSEGTLWTGVGLLGVGRPREKGERERVKERRIETEEKKERVTMYMPFVKITHILN